MTSTLPPNPLHILRTHVAQINSVFFSEDNERLYGGDLQGWVTVTSTRTLRSLARWQAHSDSVLAVQEWNESTLTHGRDHKLHVWSRVVQPPALVESAEEPGLLPNPSLLYSMDVNALNFCRFSLWSLSSSNALVALPNLVDSNYIDIWAIPEIDRRHAAIGMLSIQPAGSDDPASGRQKLGAAMAVHIFETNPPQQSISTLYCIVGYEDGSVALYSRDEYSVVKTIEGRGWTQLWRRREHTESVFSLGLAHNLHFAISTSADSRLARYDLPNGDTQEKPLVHVSKHPGNGAVAIRRDGRVCAVGGWDGKIRLYSTKSFKPLGTLTYHKGGCYAICFARLIAVHEIEAEEDLEANEILSRSLWLASGGKDSRICIWPLISFEKKSST